MTKPAFGQTMRADVWWLQPLLVFLGLSTFIVYSTWAAFQGKNYFFGNYISPFYSPELFGDSPHSWFGPKPGWWPAWLLFLAGAFDSLGAGWISAHLLLLSRRILQSVLGRSAGVHRGRTAQKLLGRAFVPADHAECASIFSLSGALLHFDSGVRRLESALVCRSRRAKIHSALASARLCWRSTLFCSAATPLAVTRCDIWSEDFAINFQSRRPVIAPTRA